MPETRSAEYESIKRGDVHASSIAFNVYQDDWRRGDGGFPVRHLVSARLDHIAPTSMPAYPDATVSLRSLAAVKEADLDEVVKDALNNDLNRYFVRTDNIDPKESHMSTTPDPEIRSTPTAELVSTPQETHVHVHLEGGRSEAKPESTPEPKAEEQPTPPAPELIPAPTPEPAPAPAPAPAPPVETAVQPTEPTPEPKPEPEPQANPGELDLWERRMRLRESEAKDFIAPPESK